MRGKPSHFFIYLSNCCVNFLLTFQIDIFCSQKAIIFVEMNKPKTL
jgi:hypothetical protein